MEERITLNSSQDDIGTRIDRFVVDAAGEMISRSMVQKICADGNLLVDGKPAGKNYKLRGSETIELILPTPAPLEALPEEVPLDIVYEDADLLVVNKPKGMVVHPAVGNESGTMVNALLHHCAGSLSGIGGVARPGIVHRIDKDTSGLLVVAKNDTAHNGLSAQVKAHSFTRIYNAVVYGKLRDDEGTIDLPIGRHPAERKRMAVNGVGNLRNAVTHYKVLHRYQGYSWLELRLETGRTHQIRVHLRHIGHPVAGDPVYGPKKVISSLRGQCLHARTLGFVHPATGESLEFTTELPPYFENFLNGLHDL